MKARGKMIALLGILLLCLSLVLSSGVIYYTYGGKCECGMINARYVYSDEGEAYSVQGIWTNYKAEDQYVYLSIFDEKMNVVYAPLECLVVRRGEMIHLIPQYERVLNDGGFAIQGEVKDQEYVGTMEMETDAGIISIESKISIKPK